MERRTGRYWAGLSSNLVIEQVLMRITKSTGRLTKEKRRRDVWVWANSVTAFYASMWHVLTSTVPCSEWQAQHSWQLNSMRMWQRLGKREMTNTAMLSLGFFSSVFLLLYPSLWNIATGVVADVSVNAQEAKEVRKKILTSMKGMHALEFTFKKKMQIVTMEFKLSLRIDDDSPGRPTAPIPASHNGCR